MQSTTYQRNKIYLVTIFDSLEKVTDYATRFAIFPPFCTFGRKQKSPKVIDLQGFSLFCFSYSWCHQESNRGHKDFQSFALPTELWHHYYLFCGCKGSETFGLCKNLGNKKR